MNIKAVAIAIGMSIPMTMVADVYISETFANYIPSRFTLTNANSGVMKDGIYANLGNDTQVAWVAGQLNSGYGRAALAPTRNSDPELASDRWMILPAVTISEHGAIVRWDARSLHRHIAESYSVNVRETGGEWSTLYTCDGETHHYSTRYASLDSYIGKDIEIAFVATTMQGFILAIDNIMVGIPEDDKFTYVNTTPHYAGNDGTIVVGGSLTYYGNRSPWNEVTLAVNGQVYSSMSMPTLTCGESAVIDFDLSVPTDGTYEYTLAAIDAAGKETVIHKDFVCVSDYPRLQLIDRCSGTWCNNCMTMELVTDKLSRYYGDELLIVEAHINDILANSTYNTLYINDNVFAIPTLIPNRDVTRMTSTVKANDYMRDKLENQTHMHISGNASVGQDGEIRIHTEVTSSAVIDNSTDNVRMAYILIGDIHEASNAQLLQSSQSLSYTAEQYYYMPNYILPEMMYYQNVPLASDAAGGVPLSLPALIQPGESYGYDYGLTVPAGCTATNLRVVALAIDTTTQSVYNATVMSPDDAMGIANVLPDRAEDNEYYDLTGRPVSDSYRGIVISRNGKKLRIAL